MKTKLLPIRTAWPWLLVGLATGVGLGWGIAHFRPDGERLSPPSPASTPTRPEPLQSAALARETTFRKATAFANSLPIGEDLSASLRALRQIADFDERAIACRAFFQRVPQSRWKEIVELFDQDVLDDVADQAGAMGNASYTEQADLFANHMAETDPADAIEQISKEIDMMDFEEKVFYLWASRDLSSATTYYHSLEDNEPSSHKHLAGSLAAAIVRDRPDSAFDWVKNLPDEPREHATSMAFHTLLQIDPEEAAHQVMQREDMIGRSDFAKKIVEIRGRHDPAETFAWAAKLPEHIGAEALAEATSVFANEDLAAATTAALSLAETSDVRLPSLMRGLVGFLAPEKAETFATILDQLPESPQRAETAARTAEAWSKADPEAASAWLTRLPEGKTRDAAIMGFSRHLVESDPEAAVEWAAIIGSAEERKSELGHLLESWSQGNRSAARAWIQHSPRLTSEDRERLLPLTLKP